MGIGEQKSSQPNIQQAGKMTVINKVMLSSKYLCPPLTCSFLCVKGFVFVFVFVTVFAKIIMTSPMIKVSSNPRGKTHPCLAQGIFGMENPKLEHRLSAP